MLEWNDAPLDSLSRSTLIHGRASDALDLIPDGSVRTVVTSPPYWSLRDYEVDRQIGWDDSLDEYIESIVDTFAKVRRVLIEDGTVWLNAGDSYSSPGWWSPSSSPPTVTARESEIRITGTPGWIEYFTTRRYGEPWIGGGVSAWYG